MLFRSLTVFDNYMRDYDIAAIITDEHTPGSHIAAVAGDAGKLMLTGSKAGRAKTSASDMIKQRDLVLVDGVTGEAVANPGLLAIRKFMRRYAEEKVIDELANKDRFKPAVTHDGKRVKVLANVETIEEAKKAFENGAEGIGLVRTEISYSSAVPSEEDLYQIYLEMSRLAGEAALTAGAKQPYPVTIRLVDREKGDKILLGALGSKYGIEYNIYDEKGRNEITKPQIKAILRAYVDSPYKNLIPEFAMVRTEEQIKDALALFEEAKKELREKHKKIKASDINDIKTGFMIETPEAAFKNLSYIVDNSPSTFYGTNDLIRFTYGVKRDDGEAIEYYSKPMPKILKAIFSGVRKARKEHKETGICGELGHDPRMVIFGLSMCRPQDKEAVLKFSVGQKFIPRVKFFIRNMNAKLSRQALGGDSRTIEKNIERAVKGELDINVILDNKFQVILKRIRSLKGFKEALKRIKSSPEYREEYNKILSISRYGFMKKLVTFNFFVSPQQVMMGVRGFVQTIIDLVLKLRGYKPVSNVQQSLPFKIAVFDWDSNFDGFKDREFETLFSTLKKSGIRTVIFYKENDDRYPEKRKEILSSIGQWIEEGDIRAYLSLGIPGAQQYTKTAQVKAIVKEMGIDYSNVIQFDDRKKVLSAAAYNGIKTCEIGNPDISDEYGEGFSADYNIKSVNKINEVFAILNLHDKQQSQAGRFKDGVFMTKDFAIDLYQKAGIEDRKSAAEYKKEWKSHIKNNKKYMMKAANKVKRGTAIILEIGDGISIPLKQLAKKFNRVILVDLDEESMIKAREGLPKRLRKKIAMRTEDVTGISLSMMREAKSIIEKYKNDEEEAFKRLCGLLLNSNSSSAVILPGLMASCDFVVSKMLISNLPRFPLSYIEDEFMRNFGTSSRAMLESSEWEKAKGQFSSAIEKTHINLLRSLVKEKGRVFVSDTIVGYTVKGLNIFSPDRFLDRKSTRLNSSHTDISRMPSSA